jgi:hypothetical protein
MAASNNGTSAALPLAEEVGASLYGEIDPACVDRYIRGQFVEAARHAYTAHYVRGNVVRNKRNAPLVDWVGAFYEGQPQVRAALNKEVIEWNMERVNESDSAYECSDDDEVCAATSGCSSALVPRGAFAGTKSPLKRLGESAAVIENEQLKQKIARLEETEATLRYQLGQSRRLESATSGQLAGQIADNAQLQRANSDLALGRSPTGPMRSMVPRIVNELDVLEGVRKEMLCREDAEYLGEAMVKASASKQDRKEMLRVMRLSSVNAPGGANVFEQRSLKDAFLRNELTIDMHGVRCDVTMVKNLWHLLVSPKTPPDMGFAGISAMAQTKPGTTRKIPYTGSRKQPDNMMVHFSCDSPDLACRTTGITPDTSRCSLSTSTAMVPVDSTSELARIPPSTLTGPRAAMAVDSDSDDDLVIRKPGDPTPDFSNARILLPKTAAAPVVPALPSPPPPPQITSTMPTEVIARPIDPTRCASAVCKVEKAHGDRHGLLTQCEGPRSCGRWFHWSCERDRQPDQVVWQCSDCGSKSGWKPLPTDGEPSFDCVTCWDTFAESDFCTLLPACECTGNIVRMCAKCSYKRVEAWSHDKDSCSHMKVNCPSCRVEKTHMVGADQQPVQLAARDDDVAHPTRAAAPSAADLAELGEIESAQAADEEYSRALGESAAQDRELRRAQRESVMTARDEAARRKAAEETELAKELERRRIAAVQQRERDRQRERRERAQRRTATPPFDDENPFDFDEPLAEHGPFEMLPVQAPTIPHDGTAIPPLPRMERLKHVPCGTWTEVVR